MEIESVLIVLLQRAKNLLVCIRWSPGGPRRCTLSALLNGETCPLHRGQFYWRPHLAPRRMRPEMPEIRPTKQSAGNGSWMFDSSTRLEDWAPLRWGDARGSNPYYIRR